MADVAHMLHFSAAELWAMPSDELRAWHDQALRIEKASS